MISELKDWLSVLATAVALASLLYTFLTRSGKEAGEKVAELQKQTLAALGDIQKQITKSLEDRDRKIDQLEDRVSRVEGELRHLPDRATVHRMEIGITEMKGDMKAIAERLGPVAAIADRLQEFLLEQAKR